MDTKSHFAHIGIYYENILDSQKKILYFFYESIYQS